MTEGQGKAGQGEIEGDHEQSAIYNLGTAAPNPDEHLAGAGLSLFWHERRSSSPSVLYY